jgi:hypothetical protein
MLATDRDEVPGAVVGWVAVDVMDLERRKDAAAFAVGDRRALAAEEGQDSFSPPHPRLAALARSCLGVDAEPGDRHRA